MASDSVGTSGVALRYAEALFELAQESKALDAIAGEVDALAGAIADSDDLRRFLASPILTRDERVNGITAVAGKAGFSKEFTNFLGLVAQNRRLFALAGMLKAFKALLSAQRGEISATVTSAKKLTEKQMAGIKAALKKVTGSDVDVEAKIDPDLLGGLVVQVGSRMVDSSIRSKLQRLSIAMKGVA